MLWSIQQHSVPVKDLSPSVCGRTWNDLQDTLSNGWSKLNLKYIYWASAIYQVLDVTDTWTNKRDKSLSCGAYDRSVKCVQYATTFIFKITHQVSVYVCACLCLCVRACVCVCVCACVWNGSSYSIYGGERDWLGVKGLSTSSLTVSQRKSAHAFLM